MVKPGLFVAQQGDAKRSKVGGVLQMLDRHVDGVALSAEMERTVEITRVGLCR